MVQRILSKPVALSFLIVLILGTPRVLSAQVDGDELFLRPSGSRFHGPLVVRLQKVLMHHGYDLGADGADGWFGPATDRALKSYQADRDIEATGRIAARDVPELPEWEYYLSGFGAWSGDPPAAHVEWFEPIDVTGRFGRIVLEEDIEAPSGGIRILVPDETGLREIAKVAARATYWSPSRRYVAMVDYDRWESALRVVVIDVLLEQAISIDLAKLAARSDKVGERSFAMVQQVTWESEHLYFRLVVDFPGPSGVPGADDTVLADPVAVAWFGIEDALPYCEYCE